MRRSSRGVVGKSDENLSGALDTLPDIQVRFATNNENDYLLVPENDNPQRKKFLRRKLNPNQEYDRQMSIIHKNVDQFQVNISIEKFFSINSFSGSTARKFKSIKKFSWRK
jgi:hypothetical protein